MLFCRFRIDFTKSTPDTSINYFSINQTSGVIYLHRSLQFDTLNTPVFKLNVIAQDQGEITSIYHTCINLVSDLLKHSIMSFSYSSHYLYGFIGFPAQSADADVYVTVKDNRPPRFSAPVYNVTLIETIQIGKIVTLVSATDPDGDTITYSIKVSHSLVKLKVLSFN